MQRLPHAHTSVMFFDRDESSFHALCYLQQDRFVAEVDRLFNGPAGPALAYAAANASPLQLAAAECYIQALRHDASTASVSTCIASAAVETAHAASTAAAFPTSSTSDSASASLPQLTPADSALVALHLLRRLADTSGEAHLCGWRLGRLPDFHGHRSRLLRASTAERYRGPCSQRSSADAVCHVSSGAPRALSRRNWRQLNRGTTRAHHTSLSAWNSSTVSVC